MKKFRKLTIVLLLTISFLIGINKVFAATCSDEQYQCITCSYKMDKDSDADYAGTIYRVTLKSDKNGTVKKVSGSLTNDSYNLDDSKITGNVFIKNNKLECIPLYVLPDNRFGTTSITVTTESDRYPTTMLEPKDNGKPFKSSSASKTLTCSGIKILSSNDSKLSEEDMRGVNTAKETATITVSGNDFSITSIDDRYKLADNAKSAFSISDFSNGCPKDMVIHCNAAEGAFNSCRLTRYSSFSENYIYSGTSTRVNSSAPSTNSEEEETENSFGTGYETRCSDVYYATLAWRIITVSAPFLLIIFTSFDYIKVVVAGNEEEMKKAKKNIPKRFIAFLILLFVPLIVRLIVTTFGRNGAQNISMFECIVRGDFGKDDTPYTHPNNGEETWKSIGDSLKELQERIQEQAANESNGSQENNQDSNGQSNTNNDQNNANNENNDSTTNQSSNNQNNTNTRNPADVLDPRL